MPLLRIRLETLPPQHDQYPAHLYIAHERCRRCNQVTAVLCIEVAYPDVDTAGRDVDTTTHFCPTCLEQLARTVREKIPELVGGAPPATPCPPPVAVILEDATEVVAYDHVRAELGNFKRSLDRIAPILQALPAEGARRVLVAALTAIGFAPEFVALFALGLDTGVGCVDPFPPPSERH